MSPRSSGPSLERKLPLLMSALLLLVVAVFCWAAYREERASSVRAATDHLRVVSRQLAELSQRGTTLRAASLARLASDSSVRRAAIEGLPVDANGARLALPADGVIAGAAREALVRATPATDSTHVGWEVWSADGARRLVVGDSGTAADVSSLRAGMRAAGVRDSVRFTPFYQAGEHVYSWAVAPVHESGRVVGYLAERRRVGNSAQTERSIRDLTGQEVEVHFSSPASNMWTTLGGTVTAAPFDHPASDSVFAATGAQGITYGTRTPVAGTPYEIALSLPEATVMRRPRAFLRRLLTIGVVLLLLSAVAASVLSRHVTRPLRHVTDAAEAVASGDYAKRVAITRRDELGRLGDTFNAMAARIGASHTELAERVEQSTALTSELGRRNDELRAAQDETMRAVRRTERLQRVTAALGGALDFDAVATVVVDEGITAAEAVTASIFLVSSDGAAIELVRAEGQPAGMLSRWARIPMDAPTPVVEAARTQEGVFVRSAEEWRADRRGGLLPPVGSSWAGLPLVARGRTIGSMGLSFAEPQSFDEEARAFLVTLSQQCAQALDRAMLFDAAVQARHAAEEARAEAEQANRAKSSFLAMMSHELRTPLNAIGGYAQLMELGVRGPVSDAQQEDLGRIQRNQRHLLSIIEDILNLARIEAGQVSVTLADVALDDVVGDVEALIAPQVADRGLRYEAVAAPGIVVRADREKLQQVLLNLVSNAVRFTEPGGEVRVSSEAHDGEVCVNVTDTGVGIPADKLAQVFEPFVQVDSGLTRRTGGTGLGLAISRDLMTAMGGRIELTSEVGVGSTFTLVLPRAA